MGGVCLRRKPQEDGTDGTDPGLAQADGTMGRQDCSPISPLSPMPSWGRSILAGEARGLTMSSELPPLGVGERLHGDGEDGDGGGAEEHTEATEIEGYMHNWKVSAQRY